MDMIYWNFATFKKSYNSPLVKRWLVSSIKNIVNELPHELPNDVRLPWGQSQLLSILSRNKAFVIVAKIYVGAAIRVFFSHPVLLDFLTLFQVFYPNWLRITRKRYNLDHYLELI